MSASSKNARKAVSDESPEVVRHRTMTALPESKAQEKPAAKNRRPQPQDPKKLATTSAFPQKTQETITDMLFATPEKHSLAARTQAETHKNSTTSPGQPEHPYHQASLRDPDEYLEILARVSKLRPLLYCICRRPEGEAAMVECSNEDECSIQWYHALCVGMTVLPGPGDNWFCERCQERKIGRLAEPGESGPKKPAELVLFDPNSQRRADPVSSTAEALPGSRQNLISLDAPPPASAHRAVAPPIYYPPGADFRKPWSKEERDLVQVLFEEVTAEGMTRGEKRYEEIARRLAERYGFEGRTAAGVRCHCARLRSAASGVGEGGMKGGSVVAGVAEASERARGKKRAEEGEEDDGDDEQEMNEGV